MEEVGIFDFLLTLVARLVVVLAGDNHDHAGPIIENTNEHSITSLFNSGIGAAIDV